MRQITRVARYSAAQICNRYELVKIILLLEENEKGL